MQKTLKIEKLHACNGCSLCFNICPKCAISMIPNSEGFIYPYINKDKCINCKLCESKCPILTKKNLHNSLTKSYAYMNLDFDIRRDSSSGGFFSAISEYILNKNGIVFGVRMDENNRAKFDYISDKQELYKFRGSKYVQADVGNIYIKCKEVLDSNYLTLFSGTPCQIAGLKSFLNKKYDNLICLDFICHGVPSPKVWEKYKRFYEDKYNSQIIKTAFRRKNDGWKQFSLSFTFANDNEYCASLKDDEYLRLFLCDIDLRNSCYDCKFKGIDRLSDITMADFWGINNIIEAFDDCMGTSLLIAHSEKGLEIINELHNCKKAEVDVEKSIKFNPAIYRSCYKRFYRFRFFKDLEKLTFDELIRKYEKKNILDNLIILKSRLKNKYFKYCKGK